MNSVLEIPDFKWLGKIALLRLNKLVVHKTRPSQVFTVILFAETDE
jgi:hypothetical protein